MTTHYHHGTTLPHLDSNQHFPIPLTIPQQHIWLQCAKNGFQVYEYEYTWNLSGYLNVILLRTAISKVFRKYAATRSRLDGKSWQAFQFINSESLPDNELFVVISDTEEVKNFPLSPENPVRFFLANISDTAYQLVFRYHHLVLDGNALKKIFQEISAYYNDPESFDSSFETYSLNHLLSWENGFSPLLLRQSAAYWNHYLDGADFAINLPRLHSNNNNQFHTAVFELSGTLSQNLRRYAVENKLSLFKMLFSAFGILIHKMTEQEDFAVSYYSNLRPYALRAVVTHYVGLQPFRFTMNRHTSLQQVVYGMNETMKRLRESEILPYTFTGNFDKQVQTTDVAFARTISGRHFLELNDIESYSAIRKGLAGEHTLLLTYDEDAADGRISCYIDYHAAYGADYVNALFSCYNTLLENILSHPQGNIGELSVVSAVQQKMLLSDWNNRDSGKRYCGSVISWFEEQVKIHPDIIAVRDGAIAFSYDALHQEAMSMASQLILHGAGPDAPVAIHMAPSAKRVVVLLAILYAGSYYLILDPTAPGNRQQYILDAADASLIVTDDGAVPPLGNYKGLVISVEILYSRHHAVHPLPPLNKTAYVRFTSGTTGEPKGVVIPHVALLNFIGEYNELLKIMPGEQVLQYTSLHFDVSEIEIWCCLCSGGSLVIYPDNRLTGYVLEDFIQEEEISLIVISPGVLATLSPAVQNKLVSLHTIIIIGEACPANVLDAWYPFCRLINGYGPTEATVAVTGLVVNGNYPAATIGRPLSNNSFYILNKVGELVPPYVVGELFIGGIQLAGGYLNQPALTASRFIDDPFKNGKLYKTGDLALFLHDGNVVFYGRNDQQVKIRGYRIELEEIVQVLLKHLSVAQAVVHVCELEEDRQLVAYLVATNKNDSFDRPVMEQQLREICRRFLPSYMVPAYFIWLDSIPLNNRGKIDRNALPPPASITGNSTRLLSSPENTIEEMIWQVWTDTLKQKNFGIDDNFFDAGGHSLQVPGLYNNLPEPIRQKVQLPHLFEYPTIRKLAAFVIQN
jgi:amino acid adenylation domain-containing protein